MERVKVRNRVHQWQSQSLAAAAANAKIEGDAFALNTVTASSTLSNNTQISYKGFGVTNTQEAIDHYGRDSELEYQKVLKGKELKRDLETEICANSAKVTGNDSTAREAAGLVAWIKTNTSKASDGTAPTGDGTDARTDGTQRALTETLLKASLALCGDNGAYPRMAVCGSFNRQKFSEFSGGANKQINIMEGKLNSSVDFYYHDFDSKPLQVVFDRFSRSRDLLLLDPEYLKFGVLRPMQEIMLGTTSDSKEKVLLTEWTLVVGTEKAHGGVFDLTTS
jgi:hypothetical protein